MKVDLAKVVKENFGFRDFDIFNNLAWRYTFNSLFYVPYQADSFESRIEGVTINAFEMIHAYEDAELFSSAIIDEDIPVFCNHAGLFGRVMMIRLLGLIDYKKASPNISEAMAHDKDAIVRSQAAESLGIMKDKKYISDLIQALREDKDSCVRRDVCKSLGLLKDRRALIPLREFFEESRAMVYRQGFNCWGWDGVKESLTAMLIIGGELAERTLEEALNDDNPLNNSGNHIYQAAKRAKYWAKVKKS